MEENESSLATASTHEEAGQWNQAIASYHQALNNQLDQTTRCRVLVRLAHCLIESGGGGEIDEASRRLEEAHRNLLPDDAETEGRYRVEFGRLRDVQGDPVGALHSFERASILLKDVPDEAFRIEILLANADCRQGELDSALSRLAAVDRGGLSNDQLADYLDGLGAIHLARGDVGAAVETLRQALDLDQSSPDDYSVSRSQLLLAEAYLMSGELRQARPLIERALHTYEGMRADAGRSDALALMGVYYEETEDFRLAAQYYQAGLDLDRTGDDIRGQARARRSLGRVYRKSGDHARAAELFAEVRQLLSRDDDIEMAALWTEEGLLALEGGEPDYVEAIRCFRRTLDIAADDGDARAIALAQRNLAKALRENNELVQAEELLRDALQPLKDRGDLRELDDLLDDLGEVLLEQGRYDEAQARLQESLEIDHQLGTVASQTRSLILLGRTHLQKGERQQAREYFQQALDLYRRTEGPTDRSTALQELGTWHSEEGELDQAIRLYRESLAIDLKRDDRVGMIRGHRALAGLYRRQGNFERAHEHLEEADEHLRGITDATERALLQLERGRLSYDEGAYREANELFESARRVFASQSAVLVATCQRLQARVAAAEGHYATALSLLENAKAAFEEASDWPELDELYDDVGGVYLASGQVDKAEDAVRKSLSIGRRMGWERGKGRSLLLLGQCAVARNDYGQALKHFEDGLETYDSIGDEVGTGETYECIGDWHACEQNPERDRNRALSMYKKARQLQLKLQNYRGVGRCHRKFAGVYRVSGDYVRAADALETAAEYLRGIDDPLELAPFEFEQGALHAANSEHSAAVQALRRALAGFQELGRQADVTKAYHYLIASYQANGDFRSALDCMREMGLQQASMWAVLVKDLHPSVARECESSFASGRFQDAVSAAFSAVENELRTRAARLERAPDATAEISRVMATWFGPPEDTPEGSDTRPIQHQFCKAAFELFRNPTTHSAFGLGPTEAFAQIAVAHLIAGIVAVKSPDDLARS